MSDPPLPDLQSSISSLIDLALAEDVGPGDLTSSSVIPEHLRFRGVMAARESLVVAGLPFAAEVFRRVVPEVRFEPKVKDGDKVAAGTVVAEMEGPARGLLTAERTALNLLHHRCLLLDSFARRLIEMLAEATRAGYRRESTAILHPPPPAPPR